jgi:hypothetical protein
LRALKSVLLLVAVSLTIMISGCTSDHQTPASNATAYPVTDIAVPPVVSPISYSYTSEVTAPFDLASISWYDYAASGTQAGMAFSSEIGTSGSSSDKGYHYTSSETYSGSSYYSGPALPKKSVTAPDMHVADSVLGMVRGAKLAPEGTEKVVIEGKSLLCTVYAGQDGDTRLRCWKQDGVPLPVKIEAEGDGLSATLILEGWG